MLGDFADLGGYRQCGMAMLGEAHAAGLFAAVDDSEGVASFWKFSRRWFPSARLEDASFYWTTGNTESDQCHDLSLLEKESDGVYVYRAVASTGKDFTAHFADEDLPVLYAFASSLRSHVSYEGLNVSGDFRHATTPIKRRRGIVYGVDRRRPSRKWFVVAGHERIVSLGPDSLVFDTSCIDPGNVREMAIARVSWNSTKQNPLGRQFVRPLAPELEPSQIVILMSLEGRLWKDRAAISLWT